MEEIFLNIVLAISLHISPTAHRWLRLIKGQRVKCFPGVVVLFNTSEEKNFTKLCIGKYQA